MSVDEEVSILWSKVPTQHSEVDCITLDSPPDSPPLSSDKKMSISQPSTSSSTSVAFAFSSIKLANVVPQLDTPEDSEQEHSKDSAAVAAKKKKKKKKKQKNPILVEKMIEQIKEAGILEKSRQRTESEDSVTYPRVKWQRYFESEGKTAHEEEPRSK